MNPRDLELLSAYLDGQLNPSDSARLEVRLAADESLHSVLSDLRSTRGLLRQLPFRRAPRNFTLTPQMARLKPPAPRTVPVFRFATALAAFLFVISIAINGLVSFSAPNLASAPLPAAMGAGAPQSVPQESALATLAMLATQSPALPPAADNLTETLAPRAMSAMQMATETPTPETESKSNAPLVQNSQPVNNQTSSPVPLGLEILFGFLAFGFGLTAWILPHANESNLRKKWNKK
jgi:hypothetical protein